MRITPVRLLLLAAFLLLAPAIGRADDEGDDDFDTTWFGARLGVWYRPQMDMKVAVSGRSTGGLGAVLALLGTEVDVQDDLGVKENATSEYSFRNGILETEIFFDSRFASVNVWMIAPYEYEGQTTLRRTVTFGGAAFTVSQPVESRFRQTHLGLDLRINILNNEYVRLSPIVAVRALGIDWEIQAGPLKGDTSDIDTPMEYGDLQIIPYPELGAEVRLGLRRWFEVDVKLTGSVVDYLDVEGHTITAEAGVTAYPIPFIGVRLGARYMEIDFESQDDDDPREAYKLDAEFIGANLSLIVRFG